jgi:hypothetical protein
MDNRDDSPMGAKESPGRGAGGRGVRRASEESDKGAGPDTFFFFLVLQH